MRVAAPADRFLGRGDPPAYIQPMSSLPSSIVLGLGPDDGIAIFATMATPAVLLLANATLIQSTINRLQAILERVRETELTISGADAMSGGEFSALHEMLTAHARRARYAHRALLSFYASAGLFMAVIIALGASALGLRAALGVGLTAAFMGSASLLAGAVFLVRETRMGIRAIDRRFEAVIARCRQLSQKGALP